MSDRSTPLIRMAEASQRRARTAHMMNIALSGVGGGAIYLLVATSPPLWVGILLGVVAWFSMYGGGWQAAEYVHHRANWRTLHNAACTYRTQSKQL